MINALLGEQVLEEGVTPTTSRIELLKHGPERTRVPAGGGYEEITLPVPILIFILSGVLFICSQYDEVINRIRLNPDDESVAMREFYNQEATSGGLVLVGSGLGNFVPWLMNEVPSLTRSLYQPVHNLVLLIYRELGIIGLLIWLSFLFYLFRYSNNL